MKQLLIIVTIIVCVLQSFAIDYIAITEVMYDTPLPEIPLEPLHNEGEFIELYNFNDYSTDLSGWSIETIHPKQTYHIPDGTIIAPHSTFLITYYDSDTGWESDTVNEYLAFKEYFCNLYNISNREEFSYMLQDTLILPNDTTILILKDRSGQTRDSMVFGIQFEESKLYAPNADIIDWSNGSLESVYSIQRRRVNFKSDGTTIYNYMDWDGWNVAYHTDEITNNSVATLTKGYFDCNIIPTETESTVELSNFILEVTPRIGKPNIDTSALNTIDAIIKKTYYDAMYRPTLTFRLHYTPQKNNLVTLSEYDIYARPTREWLPVVVEFNHLTDNTFKNNASQYYSGESRPFLEQSYSSDSWRNGIIKNQLVASQKPGADLNSHKTQFVSRGNTRNEVKLFYVTSDGTLGYEGHYLNGMLSVEEISDEENISRVRYTNLHDQVIMEKVGEACTYYVYNDLNQLCYVLPPLAANQLEEGVYNEDEDILKKYAYVYKYDKRGNQIYKRLPGCEPIRMVYDKSNALVLSQTGNQRVRGTYWTVYKYDSLRRLIYTAEIKADTNEHEELMNSFSQWLVKEYFSREEQSYPMGNTGYSRDFFDIHPTKLLTVNYYDNYDFLLFVPDSCRSTMAYSAFDMINTYSNAKGLLTGTRTYYLTGAEGYTETVFYYDYRGREIQRRTTNHLGGYDVVSTQYDFVNNITDTWSSQSTNNGLTTTEHYHYEYDHANRLLTTTYTFNNEPPIELQSYHYDELGRVRSRHIHNGIDSVAFNCDIRNQITKIKSSGYEQTYYYNHMCPIGNGITDINYNGNISATTWTYGNKINGYTYTYDNMNRLSSTYSILNNSLNVDYLYSEKFTYDPHGNITSLERWDEDDKMDRLSFTYDGNQVHSIDEHGFGACLYDTKEYHNNSNSNNDFAYDANGNMIYDQDRGIAAIRYNLLNLPDTIQFTNGNLIIHRYDAAGNRLESKYLTKKIATTVPLGNVLSTPKRPEIFYITRDAFHNNIVYTANNTDAYGIEFVHNPEGYIRYYGSEEHYHFYYIKDLLGNIRETYVHPDPEYKECIQRMQYYPSGLPWAETAGASEQPWKYNGKEFVEMHGLDEYDSKARWYYPAICRTTTMDPLAEKYYSTSPYAWCGNNPIKHVDRNGKWIESAWDAASVVIGVNSLITNIQEHNIQDAVIDGAGLILDVAAVILPVVPGGVSTAIKTARVANNVSDVVNVTTRTATKHNYRKVLQETTGKVGKGYEAHHTLPQKYRKQFEALDINIDEPGNVVWRKKENHRKQNYQHTKKWDDVMNDPANHSQEKIYESREQIELDIFENLGDTPLE